MSKILVVDDSAIARHTISKILSSNEQLRVTSAVDGVAALEEIARDEPDLVVTDLMMPNMNGLQLVAELRREYPHIPTILVTSEGSEDIAAQALREGAASYVPKASLEQHLPTTLDRILVVARSERTRLAMLSTMTSADLTFLLNNDPALIPSLIEHLQDCMHRMGVISEADVIRISVAIEEALTNALFHGNLELSSALRDEPDSVYYKLAAQRRSEERYRDRRIHITVALNDARAKFVIRDEGSGFDHGVLADPTDSANLDKMSGRGVILMRTFLDDVSYNDTGNEVTLVKECAADESNN